MKEMMDPVTKTGSRKNEYRYYLLSLGCAKNLVDAECMARILMDDGFKSVSSPELADILIVNTCGFIESAKRESIDAILELASFKQPQGSAKWLIVTGCLSQRYAEDIYRELPEVDAVLGTADYGQISKYIDQLETGTNRPYLPGEPGCLDHLTVARQPSTQHYAWIKIAEGCSNHCSYCAIPGIRGPYQSRSFEEIIQEAKRLSKEGYGELILIAQDTGAYGVDRYGRQRLPELIETICQIPEVRLVRILYTYADGVTDDLIDVLKRQDKAAHYLDIPIQHASDPMLRRMNRPDRSESLSALFGRLRQEIPDIILRTTVMVGFPGETDDDFNALIQFITDIRFDRLGCFIFSPEEGTPAYKLKNRVDATIAQERYDRLMLHQQVIAAEQAEKRIGSVVSVTLDSIDERGIFYVGRSFGEAPDTDPIIYVAASDESVELGQTRNVRIASADAYEMTGVTVS